MHSSPVGDESGNHGVSLCCTDERAKRISNALELAVPLRHPLRIHESMRYTLLGFGKHIAGQLCVTSCEFVGGHESQAMPAACAVEMINAMTLIHDDLPVMDNADLRRGKVANHKAFDEATALLAGDALLSLAFEHLASCTRDVPAERVVKAISELASAIGPEGIHGGQMLDKLGEGKKLTLIELEDIHMRKTARLVKAIVACGAIIGGGKDEEIAKLKKLGTDMGFLFQVLDDIADTTGSSDVLGKDVLRDVVLDKATYPKLMGIEGAKNYAARLLASVYQELSYFDDEMAASFRGLIFYIFNQQN